MSPVKAGKRRTDGARAADGRTPGNRGRATRERLLKCTADLLEKTSYRDLTVIEIARCAGTSPATFYQYFSDVEAAILMLARAMAGHGAALATLIREANWKGKAGFDTAGELVNGFLELWEEHRSLLRVVDLATLEGDLRFQNIRTHLLNQVTEALRDVVETFRSQHPSDLDPTAQAATIVSLLAHVASHRYGFEFWGIRTDHIRRSVTRTLYWTVTGRQPPGA
ncbi:MAG: TetR family transcriptional regulator [Actinomycetota bacterium]|nr:TetR/AcrR family transcriptional regulator [Actinomycetota bacterium]